MNEHDCVVLTRAFPDHGLEAGDVGAIVCVYGGGTAYEVEFVAANGETIAMLTLQSKDVRLFQEEEILHARSLNPVT